MASVKVMWKGKCRSQKKQKELCKFIEQLAEASHSFYEKPPKVKHFDCYIEGKILLSPSLLRFSPNRPLSGAEMVEAKEEIWNWKTGKLDTQVVRFPLLRKVYLYGIEFHLYDPRDGHNGRVSFVFPSHDKIPALNGKVVIAEDHDECQWYKSETIKQADWFLTQPSIILRYYLEQWFDYFLGWVKYFFIPNLYFWRYEGLPGYSQLKRKLDEELIRVKDRACLTNKVFNDILENFKSEAVESAHFFRSSSGEED
ncbi:MAG: hypothetical protein QW304_08875 [Thermoproteota archaeon]